MSDLAKWKVHGSVETLRTEFATWDLNLEEWQPASRVVVTSFRPDGAVSTSDANNPDGSVAHLQWLYNDLGRLEESHFWLNDGPIDRTLYSYDEAGRHVRTVQLTHDGTRTDSAICSYDAGGTKTMVRFLGLFGANVAYNIEGTDRAYSAPGAATMTTTCDGQHLPIKVVFQDANQTPLRIVVFVRDGAGRILNEEMQFLDLAGLADSEGTASMFKKVFGETFSSTKYVYDTQGRLLERTNRMGGLGEDHTTYRYDAHDDPIEETAEHTNREANLDEHGIVHYSSEHRSVQHNRFDYRYDPRGNWTERIVSIRLEPNPGFQRSNIERRAITYHAT